MLRQFTGTDRLRQNGQEGGWRSTAGYPSRLEDATIAGVEERAAELVWVEASMKG